MHAAPLAHRCPHVGAQNELLELCRLCCFPALMCRLGEHKHKRKHKHKVCTQLLLGIGIRILELKMSSWSGVVCVGDRALIDTFLLIHKGSHPPQRGQAKRSLRGSQKRSKRGLRGAKWSSLGPSWGYFGGASGATPRAQKSSHLDNRFTGQQGGPKFEAAAEAPAAQPTVVCDLELVDKRE